MHHVKMIKFTERYGDLKVDQVALYDGRDFTEDKAKRIIEHDETYYTNGIIVMDKRDYERVFRSLRSTCVGCKYESDCPSHVKCHGCAKMYTDNFETEE